MSFQNKGFWVSKDGGCLTDGEITYDTTSRLEPKRPHQWFIDGGEAGFLPNKKQALEIPVSNSFGIPVSSLSPWGSVPEFNSVPSQFTEQLFSTDAVRSTNFDERNIASVSMGGLNMGRKVMDDPFGNSSAFGLSIPHSLGDPKSGINYGGIRKVKVSEVRDPENFIPLSAGNPYARESNGDISNAHGYGKVDDTGISMGLTYGQDEDNVVTVRDSYGRDDDCFISMGQSFDKDACNTLAMSHSYKADGGAMSMANSFNGADCNIMPMAENFSKGDNNVISMAENFSEGANMISISHTYKGDSCISVDNNYNKGDDSTSTIASSSNKCESHALSMAHSFNKGDSNIISFGGYNDDDANASGRLICNYDLLMGQPSIQRSDTLNQKDVTVSNANAAIVAAQVIASGAETSSRKKEDNKSTKKTPPNNFPSNVRSLLSTGILDEVPVKYIAWSREKELRGIIKGSGYLCGCQSCNFSKVINAYEFERHAGCKTKHPNNHIYFENGKTIYGIVQELRNTPQSMLFDVIQTITGSPINQKSFRLWKESFLAATRELQRIYGKDERNQSF